MAFRRLEYIGKPDSVSSIAGSSTSFSVKVPNFINAKAHVPNAAGTVAGRKPSPGIGSMPAWRNHSIVAAWPIHPCPLIANTFPSLAE